VVAFVVEIHTVALAVGASLRRHCHSFGLA